MATTSEEAAHRGGNAMEDILEKVAKSGLVAPIHFARVMRLIPGYDPEKAPLLENQWFGGDGFPLPEQPKED